MELALSCRQFDCQSVQYVVSLVVNIVVSHAYSSHINILYPRTQALKGEEKESLVSTVCMCT